jgi:hypothetical protein
MRTRVRTSEVAAVYRDARTKARDTWTPRLRRQERRALELAKAGQLDVFGVARLAAIRDELTARGEPTLSYR